MIHSKLAISLDSSLSPQTPLDLLRLLLICVVSALRRLLLLLLLRAETRFSTRGLSPCLSVKTGGRERSHHQCPNTALSDQRAHVIRSCQLQRLSLARQRGLFARLSYQAELGLLLPAQGCSAADHDTPHLVALHEWRAGVIRSLERPSAFLCVLALDYSSQPDEITSRNTIRGS